MTHIRWIVIYVTLGLSTFLFVTYGILFQYNCSANVTNPRTILSSTVHLTHQWSKKISVNRFSAGTNILVTPKEVLVGTCSTLQGFALDGTLNWASPVGYVYSINADYVRNKVYVSSADGLVSLSLDDGTIVWKNSSSALYRTGHPIQITKSGNLFIHLGGRGIWEVDSSSGKILQRLDISQSTVSLVIDENSLYGLDDPYIIKYNRFTGSTQWKQDVKKRLPNLARFNPILTDISFNYLYGINVFSLVALDISNGEIEWEINKPKIVSNVAFDGTNIFLLNENSQLMFIDPVSGTANNYVSFVSNQSPAGMVGSFVAVEGKIVAIYFGDTNTLSVYAFGLKY
jgi:hypothetical protein